MLCLFQPLKNLKKLCHIFMRKCDVCITQNGTFVLENSFFNKVNERIKCRKRNELWALSHFSGRIQWVNVKGWLNRVPTTSFLYFIYHTTHFPQMCFMRKTVCYLSSASWSTKSAWTMCCLWPEWTRLQLPIGGTMGQKCISGQVHTSGTRDF